MLSVACVAVTECDVAGVVRLLSGGWSCPLGEQSLRLEMRVLGL